MITLQEAVDLGCTSSTGSCPIWMYNYLYSSTNSGGTINDYASEYGGYNDGYWTMNADSTSYGDAWYINGRVYNDYARLTTIGVRAVIVISK